MPEFLTVEEVAEILRVSRWSIGRLVDAGELTALKSPGRNGAVRIPADTLADFIHRRTVTAIHEE